MEYRRSLGLAAKLALDFILKDLIIVRFCLDEEIIKVNTDSILLLIRNFNKNKLVI